jgi:hypothetical protein
VNALSQFLVQLVPVECPAVREGIRRGRRHFVEGLARGESLLGGEALDLLPELCGKLAVVARDQGTPVEREVAGRERVDRPADGVGDDEVAGIDRVVVSLSSEALGARCQRQQRRLAGDVRGGTGRRFGDTACAPDGQAGAGQSEGENLICVR